MKNIRRNTENFKSNEEEKSEKQIKIAIINITKIGNDIAYKIKENIKADLYSKYDIQNFKEEESNLKKENLYLEKEYLEHKNNDLYFESNNISFKNLNHTGEGLNLAKEDRDLQEYKDLEKDKDLGEERHLGRKFIDLKNREFNFKEIVKEAFKTYDALIFISSTGIAVRSIAPFIQSKDKDPAVIVIDSTGKYVISLLSGHLGGANELTEKIAKILGAQPIITTATDNLNIKAPDIIAKENNLVIEDLKKAKDIAALLVNGEKVAFVDEEDLITLPKGYIHNIEEAKGLVFVTNKFNIEESEINKNKGLIKESISENQSNHKNTNHSMKKELTLQNINQKKAIDIKHNESEKAIINEKTVLKLVRKNIVLGIGCRKDYDVQAMKENVIKVLKEENIDLRSIHSIVSVEIKKEENAIKELSNFLGCPFTTYTIEEIKKIEHKFKSSDFVRKNIGIGSVCEPSIELKGAKIIKGKQKLTGMTLAIGKL